MACSLRKPFSEFDQNAPVRSFLDPVEGDDEPQTFDNVQIGMIFLQQAQQLLSRLFAIVCAHA